MHALLDGEKERGACDTRSIAQALSLSLSPPLEKQFSSAKARRLQRKTHKSSALVVRIGGHCHCVL